MVLGGQMQEWLLHTIVLLCVCVCVGGGGGGRQTDIENTHGLVPHIN